MKYNEVFECLVLVSGDEGVSREEFSTLVDLTEEEITICIEKTMSKFNRINNGFYLCLIDDRFKFVTKSDYGNIITNYAVELTHAKLTKSAFEVLAIIAYNQPVTKSGVDDIRGVDSGHLIRRLINRNLIDVHSKSDLPGRPNLYITTSNFLEVLGIGSISELPSVEEFEKISS